jgi:hypothetical protein
MPTSSLIAVAAHKTSVSSSSACGSPGSRRTLRRRPSRTLTSGGRGGGASQPGARPARVLGEPALGVKARVLDLAVAVEQHDGGARRRIGRERADEACARFRGPQRVLQGGPHEIEDVAVALGELTLGATESCDDRLTTLRADADRDGVLDARAAKQVALQLAVGQTAGADGLREAQCRPPAGGMREQQRMTSRVAHDRPKRGRRLGCP